MFNLLFINQLLFNHYVRLGCFVAQCEWFIYSIKANHREEKEKRLFCFLSTIKYIKGSFARQADIFSSGFSHLWVHILQNATQANRNLNLTSLRWNECWWNWSFSWCVIAANQATLGGLFAENKMDRTIFHFLTGLKSSDPPSNCNSVTENTNTTLLHTACWLFNGNSCSWQHFLYL